MSKENLNFKTTSFVTEVLASAGQLEKDDLNAKLGKLSNRIEEVKADVFDALEKKYVEFNPVTSVVAAQGLADRVQEVSASMDDTANKIEKEIKSQLNVSTAEFQSLTSELEEAMHIQKALEKLGRIHELNVTANQEINCKKYVSAARSVESMGALLDQPILDMEGEIEILSALKEKHSMQLRLLESTVNESWSHSVKWVIPMVLSAVKKDQHKKHVELHISKSNARIDTVTETVQTLYNLNLLDARLKSFAERFIQHFIKPVVTFPNTLVKTNTQTKNTESLLQIIVTTDGLKDSPVDPLEALQKIDKILAELNCLLGIKVDTDSGEVTLLKKLGAIASVQCLDLLTKECLAPAIPTNSKDLESYDQVVAAVTKFQQRLITAGFLEEADTTLTDFVANLNINFMFANKKCQQILEEARGLMTSEIHNMVQVDHEHPFSDGGLPALVIGGAKKAKMMENMALASEAKLSSETFRLPKCYVSTSVLSLMQLCYATLEEATDSKQSCSEQLFYCVRNVFELFCTAVPMYHKQSLETLPQLAALHHNNCMYIAHHLLTLGHQFKGQLPESLDKVSTFVDLVPKLRRVGTQCLLAMLSTQRDQMQKTLGQANGFQNVCEPANLCSAERAVKQMLYQLQRLASVWEHVLPANIFSKSMGTLLNTGMEQLINDVTALEDISSDDASHLHSLMSQMTDRGRHLLEAPNTPDNHVTVPQRLVKKWTKFSELSLVLSAGLQEICDRWADGKGPSANEFSANEMKRLIRALFQNTKRRDAVLAKIK